MIGQRLGIWGGLDLLPVLCGCSWCGDETGVTGQRVTARDERSKGWKTSQCGT